MILAMIRKTGLIKQTLGEKFQEALGRQISQHSVTFSSDYKSPFQSFFPPPRIKEKENLDNLWFRNSSWYCWKKHIHYALYTAC